jgi:hypothetical protein
MDASYVLDRLRLDQWDYGVWFMPPPTTDLHPAVDEVEAYIQSQKLEDHAFFKAAYESERALKLWVCQELIITNAFSQIVLFSAATLVNVHLRSMLTDVAFGEHGVVRNRLANRAHPWLLNQLRDSMNIAMDEVTPARATRSLIKRLAESTNHPLTAVAWIGVGNERLIIPEYTAIKSCFEHCLPNVNYREFLDANLNEDIGHSRLCYEVASALIALGADADHFRREAIASVDSRIQYFDELLRDVE